MFHTVQGNHVCELIHKDITTEIDQYGEYEMQTLWCARSDNQVLAYKEETGSITIYLIYHIIYLLTGLSYCALKNLTISLRTS